MEEGRKIENLRSIQEARSRKTLLKMADELYIICDAQIAIIVFSEAGTLFEYSTPNSGMEQILLRRSRILGSSEVSKEAGSGEVRVLKNKIAELKEDLLLLSSILESKEKVIVQLSEKARLQEQCALFENKKLRGQIEELQSLHRTRENITLQLFPCSVERKNSIVQDNALIPDVISGNSSVAEDEESDTNLQLVSREQCVLLENEKLHRQIVELQSLHRSRENCTLQLFPCPVERKNFIVQDNSLKPDVIFGNSSVAEMKNRTPTLNLQLGFSSNARATAIHDYSGTE